MKIKILFIPIFLAVATIAGGLATLSIDIPELKKSPNQIMQEIDEASIDFEWKWKKALELSNNTTEIIDATTATMKSGVTLFRSTLFFISLLMLVQLLMVFNWQRDNASNQPLKSTSENGTN